MKRQYYDSPVKAQDMFIEDFDELWEIISDEVMNRTGDFFTKGIVEDITITIASGTELSLPEFTFYHDKNRIEVSAQNLTIDTAVNGTFNLFADYTENVAERDEPRERRITNKKHKRIEYTPGFSISSSSDDTKVKLAEITISGNTITNVDNSKRDKPIYNIIKDTAQDFVSTWSSQKIVNYIASSLASASNPVIDTLNTPPASPSDDDRYIIGTSPTGDWSGQPNNIAQWNTETDPDAWSFTTATQGMTVYNQSLGYYVVWNGASWERFENTISLDEIPDGSTYGKIKNSQSGNITNSSGDLSTNVDGSTIQNNGSDELEVIESGINLANVSGDLSDISGDLDDIDDGTIHGKIKNTQSNEIANTSGDLSFTDSHKEQMAVYEWNSEIVLKRQYGEFFAKSGTEYLQQGGSHGSNPPKGFEVYRNTTINHTSGSPENTVLWTSCLIPAAQYESFDISFYAYLSAGDSTSREIDVGIVEKDKDGNGTGTFYFAPNQTVPHTGWNKYTFNTRNTIVGNLQPTSTDAKYITLSIRAFSSSSEWDTGDNFQFTPPVIRRLSKHGTEYTFRVKWTGDLEANSSNATILENTDNKLSSVSASSTTELNINFESGFLHEDDIATVMLGYIDSGFNEKYYGTVYDGSGSNHINNMRHVVVHSFRKINVYAYNTSNSLIAMCDDISTNVNFCDVIIRKRG